MVPADDPADASAPGPRAATPADGSRGDRLLAVRRAVDQAVGATAVGTRARASELVDDVGAAVTRVRSAIEELGGAGTASVGALADELGQAVQRLGRSLDDVRPAGAEDLRRAEERIAALEARVGELEARGGAADRDPS